MEVFREHSLHNTYISNTTTYDVVIIHLTSLFTRLVVSLFNIVPQVTRNLNSGVYN